MRWNALSPPKAVPDTQAFNDRRIDPPRVGDTTPGKKLSNVKDRYLSLIIIDYLRVLEFQSKLRK